MCFFSWLKSKLLYREPYILRLYNWNSTGTTAHCGKEQFDKVFAGYNVVHDIDKNIVYAPFHIGESTVIVIRDDSR